MKLSIVKVVEKTYMDGKFCPKKEDENLLIENEKIVFFLEYRFIVSLIIFVWLVHKEKHRCKTVLSLTF